ncbi:MAG: ABC transporter ATP-binding protein [Gemmatimonadota bacterium]|nr:ABC transporter ATP-binding protein [Gemmatimonadota bacterium]
MTGPALRLTGVAVRFGQTPGLHGLDLSVAPGERVVLLGASGSGKTTLLRAIAGLAPVAAGEIEIGGREVTGLPAESRDAVYLHQTPLLFPHLSVFENVAFPLRIRRTQELRVHEAVTRLLGSVRLGEFADRRPHTLSGGQRHRVALARAMAASPRVLLLDEPLAGLDPALRDEVRVTLLSLQAEYRPALVIVTHDLDDAAILGDRVGVLLDGGLAQLDTPERLFHHPVSLAVARFLGIANIVPGSVTGDRFSSAVGCLAVPAGFTPGPAVAVFGADALQLTPDGPIIGSVRDCRYAVDRTVVRVEVGGLLLEVGAQADQVPARDSQVTLRLELGRVTLFPGGTDV